MSKLDLKDMAIAYTAGTLATVTSGYVFAAGLDYWGFNVDYPTVIGGVWVTFVGAPTLPVVSEMILKTLGRKSPLSIWSSGGSGQGRKVQINYASGRKSAVFLSSLAVIGARREAEPVELPQVFGITIDDNDYTFTAQEMRNYLGKAYARQQSGFNAFSRKYWMTKHSPRMNRPTYDAFTAMLANSGLIADRGGKRSGKLLVQPSTAIRVLNQTSPI